MMSLNKGTIKKQEVPENKDIKSESENKCVVCY